MKPLLSILTPTIPGREKQLERLTSRLAEQIGDSPVEHLALCDNRQMTIGEKRQALVTIARGQYIAFCDDDDDISEGYISSLLMSAKFVKPDVITFEQRAIYNGQESTVHFNIAHRDEAFNPGGITKRAPWHVCAWKRERIADCVFGHSNYGEDAIWCHQARQRIRHGHHIPRILHTYRHDHRTTAAPENARAMTPTPLNDASC